MGRNDLQTDLLSSGVDHGYHEGLRVSGTVAAKFCSLGMVASVKWFTCYVVVEDGQVKMYDDEQSYRHNPSSAVLNIYLSHHHQASQIKRKGYSQNSQEVIELSCFYVQIENGVFPPSKNLKIGCISQGLAESFVKTINAMCRASV